MATRHPDWIQYDADMAAWREALDAWMRGESGAMMEIADVVKTAKAAQAQAIKVSNEIEAEYFRRKKNIESLVKAVVEGRSLISDKDGDGLLKVDADPIVDTRFYVGTYVTDWGWESAPTPVSEMLEVNQYDSVTVTLAPPPPGRDIQKWRLYRSNVGSTSAAFQFVEEFLISTLTYTDTIKAEKLGEPCPTFAWLEPPYRGDPDSAAEVRPPRGADPHLKGCVAMPNGIVAGFIDNYVAFCHPYYPYAWPVEYQITTEHPIVGLGVFGQSLFVGTMGHPYFISGADSASMAADKRPELQPCVSRRSIASALGGVLYASPDGVCLASPAGVQVVTDGLFAREDWQALQPHLLQGAVHEEVYYFWGAGQTWALDFKARKLSRLPSLNQVTALCRDVLTDGLFAVNNDRVVRLFAQGRRAGRWRSPLVVLPSQSALAWGQIDGDQSVLQPITLRWYGDGQLRHTQTVTDIQPFRLPAGRWLEQELEIEGQARVTKVMFTSSTQELKGA